MTLMEGSFGQASQNHSFKRARWRRLWRQSIQDYLIVAVQKVKEIIAQGLPTPETSAIGRPTALALALNGIRGALDAFETVIGLTFFNYAHNFS